MNTIFELAGVNKKYKTKGEFGVEIEVEGRNLPEDLDRNYWRIEKDGSLRGESYEYVSPVPTTIEGIQEALNYLDSQFKEHDSRYDFSVRAGVHVHMNVQDWDIVRLYTFITAYFILEEVLVHWCGQDREGNLFCLRMQDAEQILFSLHDAIDKKNLAIISTEDLRYCSLNPCALFKYGSLEFRAMRSDPNLLYTMDWVRIIKSLRDNSLKFSTPADVVTSMSGSGEHNFLRTMFPNHHVSLYYDGCLSAIRRGARRIQSLAFMIDWNDVNFDKPKSIDDAIEANEQLLRNLGEAQERIAQRRIRGVARPPAWAMVEPQ
jgi:hypothetical protein